MNTIIYKTTLAWSSSISSLKWLKKKNTVVNQEQNCESMHPTTPQQNQITVCAKITLKYNFMWFTYLTRNGQEFTK